MTDAFDITLPDSVPVDTRASVRRVRECHIRSRIRQEVPVLKYLYTNTFSICCSIETCGCLCLLQHLNSKSLKCLYSRVEIKTPHYFH